MWTEILGVVDKVLGMFNQSQSQDEYSKNLEDIRKQQKLSQSALQAKSILGENATRGLPGYETIKEDINTQLPTTLNESKDWLTSGGAVDFLSRASAATNKQLRDLAVIDETAKRDNMKMYAGYLGGAMANREDQLLENQSQLGVEKAYNDMSRDANINKSMTGLTGLLGQLGDSDWTKIIALLSGSKPSVDFTFNQSVPKQATFEDSI